MLWSLRGMVSITVPRFLEPPPVFLPVNRFGSYRLLVDLFDLVELTMMLGEGSMFSAKARITISGVFVD